MSVRKLNNYMNVIGTNLRIHRKQKRYSQAELVRDLNLLGINMHKNDIYKIESNQRTVKDYELWGFQKVLKISYDDLLKGIEEKLDS